MAGRRDFFSNSPPELVYENKRRRRGCTPPLLCRAMFILSDAPVLLLHDIYVCVRKKNKKKHSIAAGFLCGAVWSLGMQKQQWSVKEGQRCDGENINATEVKLAVNRID